MDQPKRIGIRVLVRWEYAYGREVLRGIAQYAHMDGNISMAVGPEHGFDAEEWSQAPSSHGLIGFIRRCDLPMLRSSQKPVISLSNNLDEGELGRIPTVGVDYAQIGRMACEHLLDRGFERLALCSYFYDGAKGRLRDAFVSAAAAKGVEVDAFELSRGDYPEAPEVDGPPINVRGSLISWLVHLPKPVGILCIRDSRAQSVLDVCRARGIRVPEDAAVLGIDDDDVMCHVCQPPLSSVAIPSRRIGFEGARLLARACREPAFSLQSILLAPEGIVVRQSTDIFETEDRLMAEVLVYIRRHVQEGLCLRDLLKAFPVGRKALQARMKAVTGRSAYQEILRARIEKAKDLLIHTEEPMDRIALASGFGDATRFSLNFKNSQGISPGRFRRERRQGSQSVGASLSGPNPRRDSG